MSSKTAASILAWLLVIASAAFAAGNNCDARRSGDDANRAASPFPIIKAATGMRADNGGGQSWRLSAPEIDDAPPGSSDSVVASKSPALDNLDNIRPDRCANKAIHPGRAPCLPDMHVPGRSSRRPLSGCATPSLAVTMPIPRSPPPHAAALP